MLEKERSDISVSRQLKLFGLPKSSYYYKSRIPLGKDAYLKEDIIGIYTEKPFYGYRRICFETKRMGWKAGEKKIRRLMRNLQIEAIYPRRKVRTTVPDASHKKYPYLLRNLTVERPNQVWVTDITYAGIDSARAYVVAIQDYWSRKVLAWRVSNTMDTSFCLDALDDAVKRHGTPEIFNTDQGSQFTSEKFISALESREIRVSMTGKGRCLDNVLSERLWRSLKYEDIKLHDYRSVAELRQGVNRYFMFYNSERPHQSLNYQVPNKVYADALLHKTG